MKPLDIRLCCVLALDDSVGDDELIARVGEAHSAGATCMMLSPGSISARGAVMRLHALRRGVGASLPLVALGRVDLVLAAELAGVHLGRDDLHPNDARRLLGAHASIGVGVVSTSEADELYRFRIDYACIGELERRSDAVPPLPDAGAVGRVAFRIRLAAPGTPVIAAATFDPAEGDRLVGAGADGLAPVWRPGGSAAPIEDLRAAIDQALALRGQA